VSQFSGGSTGGPGGAGGTGAGGPRRPASVTLREQQAEPDLRDQMDPAARSLADALRISYRFVQVAVVGIFVIFLLSGFQAVQEGERGLRLVLGKVRDDDLAPGFQFTLPEPFGEIVKVRTGAQPLRLDQEFFPSLPEQERNRPLSELRNSGRAQLDPQSDGQLLTGDFNLGHARVSVTYRRDDIRANATRVLPEAEEQMIRAAVRRGVVHAVAGTTIDDFLKQTDAPAGAAGGAAGGGGAAATTELARVARESAQQVLDQMGSGIRIDDLAIVDRAPMLQLLKDFERVQSNQSAAKKEIEAAEQERVRRLSDAAGDAHGVLLSLIDRYDGLSRAGKTAEAEAVLSTIDAIMDGREVEVEGRMIGAGTVSGEVARALTSAREYRASVVSRAQADATLFRVKLDAFERNPSVLLAGEWTEAMAAFMGRESVEAFVLPPGARVQELMLNRDPEVERQREVAAQRKAAEERVRRVTEEAERERFKNAPPPKTVEG
jgi:regulator of protease activity HflC (stomatin/prohibitin superfamily)